MFDDYGGRCGGHERLSRRAIWGHLVISRRQTQLQDSAPLCKASNRSYICRGSKHPTSTWHAFQTDAPLLPRIVTITGHIFPSAACRPMQGTDRQNCIALVVTPMIALSGPSTYDRTLSHVMHWEIPAIVSFYKYVGIRRVPGSFRSTDPIRHPIWSQVPLTDSPALDEINGGSRSDIGGNTRLRCTIRTLAMTSSAAYSYFCSSAQIDC